MLIEIYGDLICPWCLIGRVRLARALARRTDARPTEIRRRSFQLNPDLPAGGVDRVAHLGARMGGRERLTALDRMVTETAAAEGLTLNFDRIERLPNTRDAHRLVRLAEARNLDDAVADALARAHFLDGADLGDHEVLARVVEPLGFERTEVSRFLEGGAETAAVRASDARARRMGLQAIPSLVFNGRFVVAGAQEPECLAPLLAIEDV